MLRPFLIFLIVSAAITAGVSYLGEKNIAEKQFLLDNGITTTAAVTGYKISKQFKNNISVEVYYSFRLPNGLIVNSYYMPPLEESPVNQNWRDDSIFPNMAPKTVEIMYINEPPYLSALKKEILKTTANKGHRLNTILIFFFGSFSFLSIFYAIFTWNERRRKRAAAKAALKRA